MKKLTVIQNPVGASPTPSILSFLFLPLAFPSWWLSYLGQPQTCHSEPGSPVELSRFRKSNAGPQHIWQSNCASLLMFVPLIKATLFSKCLSTARTWRGGKRRTELRCVLLRTEIFNMVCSLLSAFKLPKRERVVLCQTLPKQCKLWSLRITAAIIQDLCQRCPKEQTIDKRHG